MDSRPSPTQGPAAGLRRFRPFECRQRNGSKRLFLRHSWPRRQTIGSAGEQTFAADFSKCYWLFRWRRFRQSPGYPGLRAQIRAWPPLKALMFIKI